MRTNEERIEALHKRAVEIEIEDRHKKAFMIQVVSVAACMAIITGLAFYLSSVPDVVVSAMNPGSMAASIFSENGVLGFIVIGVIAFLLGVFLTIFCYRLKKWQEGKDLLEKDDK